MISMISVFKTQSNTFALYSPYFFLRITNSIKIASIIFCRGKNGSKSVYLCAFRALYSHSKTACRGFKSFCPCHSKNGLNTAFKPFFYCICIHIYRAFSTVFLPKYRMKCFKFHRFRPVHHQYSITFSVCFLR